LKIENGLGLLKMTLPDLHQDAVVLGQCLNQIIIEHDIKLKDIARIYVGTESSIDSSKPIASF
jgi:hydroxymethylglutaryl-CoA synthase